MPAPEKSSLTSPVGIIAGGGMLPRALAQKCVERGDDIAVVALSGFANVDDFAPHLRTSIGIGRGRSIIRFFRDHHVRDLVIIGGVHRPSLWDIRTDWWTFARLAPKLLRGGLGDDGLLKAVRVLFENEGFRIHAIQTYLPDLIAAEGALGAHQPDEHARYDIKRGFAVARLLGAADVGQAVVVQGGIVLGVEAAEGTDALIKRCGAMKRAGSGPVLVKAAKPGQDTALDLPTIGPSTVENAIQAGFSGIVVEAGRTLMADPIAMIALADPANLFVHGSKGP